MRNAITWASTLLLALGPLGLSLASPLLEWREPVYVVAGAAGVLALSLILVQPLLVGGYLPGLEGRGRSVHRWIGGVLVLAVVVHVGGLWLTSPPDVMDALTFSSPTPFSLWGVLAMWALFAAAILAGLRKSMRSRLRTWRVAHTGLAIVVVGGTVAHALLIDGTMESLSKGAICVAALLAIAKVVYDRRAWSSLRRSRQRDDVA